MVKGAKSMILFLLFFMGLANVFPQAKTSTKGEVTWVWWEGENVVSTNFPPPERNPFAPQNLKEAEVLSEGRWIGVTGDYGGKTMFAEYVVKVPKTEDYHFYIRKFWKHGPFRWRFDEGEWHYITREVSLLDEEQLRLFVVANWIYAGKVRLSAGEHKLRLELTGKEGAACFDCFLLISQLWLPKGKLKPNETPPPADEPEWFAFDPSMDEFKSSPIDLRFLNEKWAGEKGFIWVKGDSFVHSKTGEVVRFWGVNAGPDIVRLPKLYVDYLARLLAKHGVNIVRVHGSIWRSDNFREVDKDYLDQLFYFISAMKKEGIYTEISLYFPLWLQLSERDGFAGYKGNNPFALLFFNPDFQAIYRNWLRTLLTTPNPYTKIPLKDEPALALLELVNEDSFLFWTFNYDNIPAPQMAQLEREFGEWVEQKYGSLENALKAWNGRRHERDNLAEKRLGFIHLWNIFNERDQRCQDTATFLTLRQKRFFEETISFLKKDIGLKSLIVCSNWITADETRLGPLDKWSNTVGDVMDRHGYFGGPHEGEGAGWSIRVGHRYDDRCALLEPRDRNFSLPLLDITYNNKPSIISEVNWTPPNRFRADFPILFASYGNLQGSDGVFFFALSGFHWDRTQGKFAIQTPTVMGQFPVSALMYRKGLLKTAPIVVEANLKLSDLFALKGAPVRSPVNLDELRKKDIPPDKAVSVEGVGSIDPLSFLVGRVAMNFTENDSSLKMMNLAQFIDREKGMVKSATGELLWDFQRGILTINAPKVQGVVGFLNRAGGVRLGDVTIESPLEYGAILLVSLDDQPIRTSRKLLLQVMSEEQNKGWSAPGEGVREIKSIGTPPIMVRKLAGTVQILRSDASRLKVVALDENGYPLKEMGNAERISLQPKVVYYLVSLGGR